MPDVPTYRADSVQLQGATGARAANIPGDSFGGEIARGLGDVAANANQVQGVEERRADLMDVTAAKDLDTQYAAFERQTLWGDGQTPGYLQSRGRDALNARPAVEQALNDKAKALAEQATSPGAALRFRDVVAQRLQSSLGNVAQHAAEAADQDFVATSTARMTLQSSYASATYKDPATQQTQIATGLNELASLAQHQGWGPDIYAAKKLEYLSGIHGNAVAQMIDDGDARGARSYLEQHSQDIDPGMALKLKGALRDLSDISGAQAAANAVLATGAHANDGGTAPVGQVAAAITNVAKAAGATPDEQRNLVALATIESSLNPSAKNGSSTGLFQFQPGRFADLGGKDINDPTEQTQVMLKAYRQLAPIAQAATGHAPQAWEIYMLHQQGVGGGKTLLTSPPDVNAVAALAPAYGGDVHKAEIAILKNGGNDRSTVGDFLDLWRNRVNAKLAVAGSPAAGSTAPGPTDALPDRASFVAQAVAMAPSSDPRTIAKYQAAAEAKWSDLKTNQEAADRAAEDAVQPTLRDPAVRSVDQFVAKVGPSLWASLPEKTKTTITEHYGSGGFAKDSDPVVLAGLQQMQANNPQGFARLDLTQYTPKLSSGNFGTMLDDQKKIRTGGGDAQEHVVNVGKIMNVTGAMLTAVGIDPTPKASDKGSATLVSQFQSAMLDAVAVWRKNNNNAMPEDKQIQQMADTYLLGAAFKKPGALWGTTGHVFEVPRGTPYEIQVPSNARADIVKEFRAKFGSDPSSVEIQANYRRRHANGQYR